MRTDASASTIGNTDNMTPDETLALTLLAERGDLTSRVIGGELGFGKELAACGAAVGGHLRRKGLAVFLPDIRLWRITAAGRAALSQHQT